MESVSLLVQQLNKIPHACSYAPVSIKSSVHGRCADTIKKIGGWFVKKGTDISINRQTDVFSLTPLHGRVACCRHPDNKGWVLIKGGGWTYGGARVLMSPKDAELCFGLYDDAAAKRELAVSNWLEDRNLLAARVLGYAYLDDPRLEEVEFRNGLKINPVLLYTSVKYPLRVLDLAYFDDRGKSSVISDVSNQCGWSASHFIEECLLTIASSVADYQQAGGCNDTLDPGNVTLAGEITDFEWVGVPDVPLPWGDFNGDLMVRRQKEVVYIYDMAMKLTGLLQAKITHEAILEIICDGFGNKVPDVLPILSALRKDIVFNANNVGG